jgi:hypothetical protein
MKRDLSKHALISDAMEGLRPSLIASLPRALERLKKTGSFRNKNPKPHKSSAERFHYMVFQSAEKVVTDFKTLENIISMVRRIPTRRTFMKWNYTADKWLEYQYTLYLVTMVGVIDRCLMLINAVLLLGLDEQDCKEGIILRHHRIKGTKYELAIKRLMQEVKPLRTNRNLDVHRKDLPPFYEILECEEYDWWPLYAQVNKDGETLIPPELLQKGFRVAGQMLASKMQKGRTKLKYRVWRIFDLLAPAARKKLTTLSHTR